MSAVVMQKQELRREMRQQRSDMPKSQQINSSIAICKVLHRLPGLASAKALLGTLPVRQEIDATIFLKWWLDQGRELYMPKVEPDGIGMSIYRVEELSLCRPGYRGCPEPAVSDDKRAPITDIDIVLVPGLAFDHSGNRLGQGGGHFDRLLSQRLPKTLLVGMAYDFQILPALPVNPAEDQCMDWLATPSGLLRCN